MAAGDEMASLSLSGSLGLPRRSIKSSTSLGRCPVRSSSLRLRWLSSGVFFVRVNQSAIREVLHSASTAATLTGPPPPLQFFVHHQNIVRDWYFDWSSHLTPP